MGNADEFLDLYKRLEGLAVDHYGLPSDGTAVSRLKEMDEFRDVRQELSYCRDVRNLLQHRYQLDGNFAVEPSDGMVKLLRDLMQKIEHPLLCSDAAVEITRVYWRSLSDPVLPAMRVMRERGYAYVPIFDGESPRRLHGVFGEHSIFSYLIDDNADLGEDCTFASIERYLLLNAQAPFRFAFLPCAAPLNEAEALIERGFHRGKRVGMIFLTRSGQPDEPVSGILTPYDILVRGKE